MRAIIIESNFVIILKVRSLTLSAAAVEVGHVVEEDVGRDGHFLLPTLYVPVGQRDFPWKEKYYLVFLLRRR